MSGRRININITESPEVADGMAAKQLMTREIVVATVPPKLAASMLRALADELDPPRAAMRQDGIMPKRGGSQ